MLFAHWDESESVQQNLDRIQRENVFGKATRCRIEDVLAIFRQRYLREPSVLKALVRLCRAHRPTSGIDRILYFHACQADTLLHDVVTEVIYDLYCSGRHEVDPQRIRDLLVTWVAQGKTTARWSESTFRRVTQGLLATLRDFGVLEGAVNKRIAASFLALEAFAYVAFYLRQRQPSGDRLLRDREWRLFLLSPDAVERFFLEAHQAGLLEYHAAGSVIRIDFPAASLEDYAHVIAQRTH